MTPWPAQQIARLDAALLEACIADEPDMRDVKS